MAAICSISRICSTLICPDLLHPTTVSYLHCHCHQQLVIHCRTNCFRRQENLWEVNACHRISSKRLLSRLRYVDAMVARKRFVYSVVIMVRRNKSIRRIRSKMPRTTLLVQFCACTNARSAMPAGTRHIPSNTAHMLKKTTIASNCSRRTVVCLPRLPFWWTHLPVETPHQLYHHHWHHHCPTWTNQCSRRIWAWTCNHHPTSRVIWMPISTAALTTI